MVKLVYGIGNRIKLNLCTQCGRNPPAMNHLRCQKCLDRSKKYTSNRKTEILQAYGGKCVCCGETEEVFLTIDHIYNDGKKHRQEISSKSFYSHIRKLGYPQGRLQVLCANCHLAKTIKGICPHQNNFT